MKPIAERLFFTPPKYYHGTISPVTDSEITGLLEHAFSEAEMFESPYTTEVLDLVGHPVMVFPDGRESDGHLYQLKNGMITHNLVLEYFRWYKSAIQESEILKLFQLGQFYGRNLSAELGRIRYGQKLNARHRGQESLSDSLVSKVDANRLIRHFFRLKKLGHRFVITACYLPRVGDEIEVLADVSFLEVSHCYTENILANFAKFGRLSTLILSNNRLQELPKSLLSVPSLTFLNISNNYLYDVSSEIPAWCGIKKLYLDNNRLKELPSWLSELDQLEVLSVGSNPLEKFHGVSGLVSLKELDLRGVPANIDIDPAIMELPHLNDVKSNPDLPDKIDHPELAQWFRKHIEKQKAYQKQMSERDPNPMAR